MTDTSSAATPAPAADPVKTVEAEVSRDAVKAVAYVKAEEPSVVAWVKAHATLSIALVIAALVLLIVLL